MYSSADVSHPILVGGTSGSLLALLNSCLVTGYGAKPGAGWTKTGSLGAASGLLDSASCGIFCMPTGSKATMFLIDNGIGSSGLREARLTGFDSVTQFTASFVNPTVTGSNQFPTLAQLAIGNGAVVIRKSVNLDSIERPWVLFADSSSMYAFITAGDASLGWAAFTFGDIFSIKSGSVDTSSCIIAGRNVEGTGTITSEKLDVLNLVNVATAGHFMQRSYTGTGGSITCGKHGDSAKGSATVLLGITQFPNPVDVSLWVSPVWVHENTSAVIRGRMRGFWHVLHPVANFTDGQSFYCNTGDYAGKVFQIFKGGGNGGMYAIETSATVETD